MGIQALHPRHKARSLEGANRTRNDHITFLRPHLPSIAEKVGRTDGEGLLLLTDQVGLLGEEA